MFDVFIWLGLVLFCQASVLRIWLDGEIFFEVQETLIKYTESRYFIIRKLAYLLTCWQCLGVWVAWGILVAFSFIPQVPDVLKTWYVIILMGFMISLLSELLHHYVLRHLDTVTPFLEPELWNDTPEEPEEKETTDEKADERNNENDTVDTDSTSV